MRDVYTYTSYNWMKEHGDKFAVQHWFDTPALERDGMVREGKDGGRAEMSTSLREKIRAQFEAALPADCLRWYREGGSVQLAATIDHDQRVGPQL
eukprot:g75446.t1